MRKAEIEQAFIKNGLKRHIPVIDRLTRNSIRLLTTSFDESTGTPGMSKIGGHPDLPGYAQWPNLNGQPLSFVAQIRLADLQQFDSEKLLPRQGMLWFFYDAEQETFGEQPEDRHGWSILFDNSSATSLRRLPPPAGLQAASIFQACSLTPQNELTLALQPDLELPGYAWSDEEQLAYEEVLETFQTPTERSLPHHRLLGYPNTIQDDMRIQCQLVSNGITDSNDPRAALLEAGAADWLLLLQIDSDAFAKMRWANNGMLYYWIRRDDLQAQRFEKSWLVLQSE